MREIVKVETEVLNFLQKTTGESDGYMSQTVSEAMQAPPRTKSEVYQVNPQLPQQPVAPQAPQVTHSSQANLKSEGSYPQNYQQSSQGQFTWGKNQHESKPLSEDTLEIIGYIERRALG